MSSASASNWFSSMTGGGSSQPTKKTGGSSNMLSKAKAAIPGSNAALEKNCKEPKFKKANAKKCQHATGLLGSLTSKASGMMTKKPASSTNAKTPPAKKSSMFGNMNLFAKKTSAPATDDDSASIADDEIDLSSDADDTDAVTDTEDDDADTGE